MFLAVAISMMFATSCQQGTEIDVVNEGVVSAVSFSINTPAIASRDFSDGLSATQLQYAIYDNEGNILPDFTVTDGSISGSTTIELQLVVGATYQALFWAANAEAPYTVDLANKKLTIDYSAVASNNEKLDAFYKYDSFTVTENMVHTIELKRPFAQLNIGTNDIAAAKKAERKEQKIGAPEKSALCCYS